MKNKVVCVAIFCILSIFGKKLYAQQFTEQTDIVINGASLGNEAWGDYDNDGKLDIILGNKVYKNNGNNSFTEQTNISLPGGAYALGDYDNDGDLDILVGNKIYKNNGNSFIEQTAISLIKATDGSSAWGDYDNDGDLDILLTGVIGPANFVSKIYKNNGDNSFTDQTDISLTGVGFSSVSWADYDNDGNLDILLTGFASGGSIPILKIYKNNGHNGFSELTGVSPAGVIFGSAAWGDYDNDGDLDILLAGDRNPGMVTKIYRNNGNSSFTVQTNISFDPAGASSAAWGDYDNDGYLDVLLTGVRPFYSSKIYKNNGDSSFTEQTDISLNGANSVNVAWGDYDNDGDLDILLTGNTSSGNVIKIYKNNNAAANSKPITLQNLKESIEGLSVTFSWDVGTDPNQNGGLNYNLYVYDVDENKYPSPAQAFRQTETQNGKRLVARIGNIQKNNHMLTLPPGNYLWSVQAIDASFEGGSFAEEKSFTIQGINIYPESKQVIVPGQNGTALIASETPNTSQREWKFSTSPDGPYQSFFPAQSGNQYIPNFQQEGNYYVICESVINSSIFKSNSVEIEIHWFSEQKDIPLPSMENGSSAWGDYDNDGYLDILLCGNPSPSIKIYKNNGYNSFTEQRNIMIPVLYESNVLWGDYDRDGYLDILVDGPFTTDYCSRIYKNNRDNSFKDIVNIIATKAVAGSVAWGDYDNDGDLDILITGRLSTYTSEFVICKSAIYKNNGNESFTEQSIPLTGVYYSSVAWGDYDNDGDLDILLSGATGEAGRGSISKIYKNNGNNSFTEQKDIVLTGISEGSVAWGDYDNDGDLDILLTGSGISKIYKNNGNNVFIEQTTIAITGVSRSNLAWGDYDNDGNLDILLCGYSGSVWVNKIYKNNGDNSFLEQTGIALNGGSYNNSNLRANATWGDYDNDGDLDILLTGAGGSKIYRNNCPRSNIKLITPSNLQESINANEVSFSWDIGSEPNQNKGLNYNLYVYNLDKGLYASPPHAFSQTETQNGKRLLAQIGSIQKNEYKLALLKGNYSWSVQSINPSLKGSNFAEEQTFTVAPFLKVSTKALTIPCIDKSIGTFNIASSIGWTAVSDQRWLTISSISGSGNAKITLTSTANPEIAPRTASITISGLDVASQTINITQEGAAPSLSVSTNTLTIAASANSTNTFNVTSNTNWTTTSDQDWLTLSSALDSGNATIILTALSNPSTITRTATITISGTYVTTQTISVTQEAGTTSISEVIEDGIKIYPNPVSGILNIDFANNQIKDIKLTDANGKTVLHKTKVKKNEEIDLSKFEKGIYILSIQSNKGIISTKIIRE